MRTIFHKQFQRQFTKLSERIKNKFEIQLEIFYQDAFDSRLENHELYGKYRHHRSINVTGDIRAIYKAENEDAAIFVAIVTHSQLYS